jgi:hypothetical protein
MTISSLVKDVPEAQANARWLRIEEKQRRTLAKRAISYRTSARICGALGWFGKSEDHANIAVACFEASQAKPLAVVELKTVKVG